MATKGCSGGGSGSYCFATSRGVAAGCCFLGLRSRVIGIAIVATAST